MNGVGTPDCATLQVSPVLAAFIEEEVLPGLDLEAEAVWRGLADVYARFAPETARLLAVRVDLQAQIDAWHSDHAGGAFDMGAYEAFLRQIGYLTAEPVPFAISPQNVDDEVARFAGPQLVAPVLNARFVLNAANARWGSLYDALYGTDAIPGPVVTGGYDPARGAQVIAWAKAFLDDAAPLEGLAWAQATSLAVVHGRLAVGGCGGATVPLRYPDALVGYRGPPERPDAVLLRHHGLHLEVGVAPDSRVGRTDLAGIADVMLESALTTIVDLEDSIAAVDADDKVAAYRNWLGLMKGDLVARFEKGGATLTRALAPDRRYNTPHGGEVTLPGRSLLFVRNVGHLMTTPAVRLPDGSEAPEGILDAVITSLIALHDLKGTGALRNSRAGSIYIVKPKMHGPDEAALTDALFDAVEDMLGLARHTIKVGVMDEERRTSANLAACIAEVQGRVVFINTGFLDRTGDEMHTSMRRGAMIPKAEMKASEWIAAYEDRNVQIGLACGLAGRAQIGKGMWAAPDKMADMLDQKIAHPRMGASTAWAPSPTAATLHATHYHRVDVAARQAERRAEPVAPLQALLIPPVVAAGRNWTPEEVRAELDNNAQGILGYVVRWVDQGIGCSKVPDIHDVGLMEDRATLRISSQHMANWMLHGVATSEEVDAALRRMAGKVDAQNAGDPLYEPMSGREAESLAFQAARALVFEGLVQPNGYTEPLLHRFRAEKGKRAGSLI